MHPVFMSRVIAHSTRTPRQEMATGDWERIEDGPRGGKRWRHKASGKIAYKDPSGGKAAGGKKKGQEKAPAEKPRQSAADLFDENGMIGEEVQGDLRRQDEGKRREEDESNARRRKAEEEYEARPEVKQRRKQEAADAAKTEARKKRIDAPLDNVIFNKDKKSKTLQSINVYEGDEFSQESEEVVKEAVERLEKHAPEVFQKLAGKDVGDGRDDRTRALHQTMDLVRRAKQHFKDRQEAAQEAYEGRGLHRYFEGAPKKEKFDLFTELTKNLAETNRKRYGDGDARDAARWKREDEKNEADAALLFHVGRAMAV